MKKIIFSTIITALFLGCNDSSLPLNSTFETNSISNQNNRFYSDQFLDSLAIYHNLHLGDIINQLNLEEPTDINSNIENIGNGFMQELSLLLPPNLPAISYEQIKNYEDVIDAYISNKLGINTFKNEIEDILMNLNIESSNCYTNLVIDLELLRQDAMSTFSGTDLDGAISLIEGAKKSAYFWLPFSAGGLGNGSQLYNDFLDYNPDYIPGAPSLSYIIGRVALADCIGVFAASMVVASVLSTGLAGQVTLAAFCMFMGGGPAAMSCQAFFNCFL